MPNDNTSERKTRSNSNASSITLEDIKSLIENSTAEILKGLRQEVDTLKESISSLHKRVDQLDTANAKLASRCQELQQKCSAALANKIDFDDVCRETEERWKRRNFIIISGLQEKTSGSLDERKSHDAESVKDLLVELDAQDCSIEEMTRIGRIDTSKPRLLRVKCEVEDKFKMLRQARKLRDSSNFKNVYINPDMTRFQRQKNAELRAELRRRREAGEKVGIRRGQVVDLTQENFL